MRRAMTPPLDYIDCSLPHEAMTLGEYRRTRVSAAGAARSPPPPRSGQGVGSRHERADEVRPGRGRHPDALGQPAPRPPGRAAAAAEPADRPARRPRRPDADLPDGADRAGGLAGAGDRDPGRGPRRLPAVAPDAAVPRAPARAGARHAGEDLLQVRGRLARRLAQAQHRRPAGLRERAGRDQEARDRDRRRPVGLLAGVRLLAVRPRVRGLHGRLELRPEALPALDDADLGRDRAPLAVGAHAVGPRAGRASRPARWGSRSPRRSRSPRSDHGHQLRARLGAQPRAAAPDRDRPGGDRAARARRRVPGRDRRLRRRRLELRRADVPVHARDAARARTRSATSPPSPPPARR